MKDQLVYYQSKLGYETDPSDLYREMNIESTKDLDKDKLYVVYCDGIGCNASTKGAMNMLSLGFNVKELMGGLDWWKKDGYQTEGSGANPGEDLHCAC
jgi:rhodanese-related sulfurtransferase